MKTKCIDCLACILLTQTLVRKYLRTQTHNVVDIVINFNHRIKINGNGIKKKPHKNTYIGLNYHIRREFPFTSYTCTYM